MDICKLCNRTSDIVKITKHHIIPKSKKGKNIDENYILLCEDCHSQIHLLYNNNFIKTYLNSEELILSDEKLKKFAKFASKQITSIKRKESNDRKN